MSLLPCAKGQMCLVKAFWDSALSSQKDTHSRGRPKDHTIRNLRYYTTVSFSRRWCGSNRRRWNASEPRGCTDKLVKVEIGMSWIRVRILMMWRDSLVQSTFLEILRRDCLGDGTSAHLDGSVQPALYCLVCCISLSSACFHSSCKRH